MRGLQVLGAFTLAALNAASQALADGDDEAYYINAKVVRVIPVVRVVQVATPREHCWYERVRHVDRDLPDHENSALPVILGGVVGGVVGNQVGRRRHRGALTVAGSLIGAVIGHGVSKRRPQHYPLKRSYVTTERHCEIETDYREEERIEGYEVTYRYNGRYFTTRTDQEPGERIRVRVQVEPVGDADHAHLTGLEYRGADRVCLDDCFDS
jgi:uncharacterized protein YcfJ